MKYNRTRHLISNLVFLNVTMLISCMHAISRDLLVVCMCLVAMIFQVLITSALIEGKLLLIIFFIGL